MAQCATTTPRPSSPDNDPSVKSPAARRALESVSLEGWAAGGAGGALLSMDTWARRFFDRFKDPAIEAAFNRYMSSMWMVHFVKWAALSALCMILPDAIARLTRGTTSSGEGEVMQEALQPAIYVLSGLLLSASLGMMALMRWFPGSYVLKWLLHQHQPVLLVISMVAILGVTLPVLSGMALVVEDVNQLARNVGYLDGSWHMLVSTVGAALLACSGMSPRMYSAVSLLAFGLWIGRNSALRVAFADAVAAHCTTFNTTEAALFCQSLSNSAPERTFVISVVLQSLPVYLVNVLVCFQRDSLTRQNFVVLQLVQLSKERTIHKLKGEKVRRLSPSLRPPKLRTPPPSPPSACPPPLCPPLDHEFSLSVPQRRLEHAVYQAQAEAQHHIKFVMQHSPRQKQKPKPSRLKRRAGREGGTTSSLQACSNETHAARSSAILMKAAEARRQKQAAQSQATEPKAKPVPPDGCSLTQIGGAQQLHMEPGSAHAQAHAQAQAQAQAEAQAARELDELTMALEAEEEELVEVQRRAPGLGLISGRREFIKPAAVRRPLPETKSLPTSSAAGSSLPRTSYGAQKVMLATRLGTGRGLRMPRVHQDAVRQDLRLSESALDA